MPTPILIYGLQRACTNLAVRLAAESCDCYQANTERDGRGWKHAGVPADLARIPIDGAEPRILLCVRNPLDWMASCYDYFRQHKGADKTICRSFRRGWTFDRFCRSPHYTWSTPAARWNDYYAEGIRTIDLLVMEGRPAAIVRAEQLATPAGQLAELARLVDELRLDLVISPHAIVQRVNNRGRLEQRRWDSQEYARRVANHWTPPLRTWVCARIDWCLAGRFDYAPR